MPRGGVIYQLSFTPYAIPSLRAVCARFRKRWSLLLRWSRRLNTAWRLPRLRQGTGQTLQAVIPAGVPVECECSTPKCRYAHFEPKALREVSRDSFEKRTKEVLIGYNNYQHPLGSVSKGTLRGKMVGDDLQIEVDIPDTQSGLELIQAVGFCRAGSQTIH